MTKRNCLLLSVIIGAVLIFLVGCGKEAISNSTEYANESDMDNTNYDRNESAHQTEILEQENKAGDQKKEEQDESAETELEPKAETESKAEMEIATDNYGPVKVSQIDYDSFQSRMTDEEWVGFQQYFPVLKDNATFEVTDYYDGYIMLNQNGEVVEEEENALFYRWDSKEVTDISHYAAEPYGEGSNEEMMVNEVKVFDLDRDGIQELIIEWSGRGDILILHCETEKFYGWESVYRGFLMLQTNGTYRGSGGADCSSWQHLRFDNGSWIEEEFAVADRGEYSINGEAVDEDTFWKQMDAYKTGDVTGYKPKQCVDAVKIFRTFP